MKILMMAMMMVGFTLSGCAVIDKIESSPLTSELVTNQLTLRFIAASDDPVIRARKLRETIDRIQAHVDSDTTYTLASIDEAVRAEIDWDSMSIADQQLVDFAIRKASEAIGDLIGKGVVDPDERHTISAVLVWIKQAAVRVH